MPENESPPNQIIPPTDAQTGTQQPAAATGGKQQTQSGKQEPPAPPKKSPSEQIIELLPNSCKLFKSQYGELFAKVTMGNTIKIMKIRSQEFTDYIILQYYGKHKKVATFSSVNEAINYVAAHASFFAPEEMVFHRVGSLNDIVYVDMANKENEAIEIAETGWKVIQNPPVNFIRSSSIRPLSTPVPGSSLTSLKKYVKVSTNADFLLLVSWMAFSLNPDGPYPILFIRGDEGATKSNLIKMIHTVVDPSLATNLSMPKNKHDVYITAANARIVSYDNLSKIPKWFSDELCVISTGNDFATRQYYTVDQQALLHAKRPQIISGINNNLAVEKDLLDRIVSVTLLPLTREERKDEKSMWEEFHKIKGHLLGALCTVVTTGLKYYGSTNSPYLPRMADFAKFIIACETALPCKPGDFMRAYENNIMRSKKKSRFVNHVVSAMISLMQDRQEWKETAEKTIIALSQYVHDTAVLSNPDTWPQIGNKLRAFIKNSLAALTEEGISVQFDVAEKGKRYLIFTNIISTTANQMSVPIPESQEAVTIESDPLKHVTPEITAAPESEASDTKIAVPNFTKLIDVEILASVLAERYQIPVENIESVNMADGKIIVKTSSGEVRLDKKALMTEEQRLFEESIEKLSTEEQKLERTLFEMSNKLK